MSENEEESFCDCCFWPEDFEESDQVEK